MHLGKKFNSLPAYTKNTLPSQTSVILQVLNNQTLFLANKIIYPSN